MADGQQEQKQQHWMDFSCQSTQKSIKKLCTMVSTRRTKKWLQQQDQRAAPGQQVYVAAHQPAGAEDGADDEPYLDGSRQHLRR